MFNLKKVIDDVMQKLSADWGAVTNIVRSNAVKHFGENALKIAARPKGGTGVNPWQLPHMVEKSPSTQQAFAALPKVRQETAAVGKVAPLPGQSNPIAATPIHPPVSGASIGASKPLSGQGYDPFAHSAERRFETPAATPKRAF